MLSASAISGANRAGPRTLGYLTDGGTFQNSSEKSWRVQDLKAYIHSFPGAKGCEMNIKFHGILRVSRKCFHCSYQLLLAFSNSLQVVLPPIDAAMRSLSSNINGTSSTFFSWTYIRLKFADQLDVSFSAQLGWSGHFLHHLLQDLHPPKICRSAWRVILSSAGMVG